MTLKVWASVISLVTLSGAGLFGIRSGRDRSAVAYGTMTVQRGNIAARVNASGTVSALVTTQVGSQVSGRVQEIFVDFNAKVSKGQLLARIDPQIFQAALAQSQASYRAALGRLAKARANADNAVRRQERARGLAAGRLLADADFEQAQAEAKAARAEVAATRGNVGEAMAAVQQAKLNVGFTTIVSPADGVVISRNVDVGQTVAASLQAPTLFTIAGDLTKMQVDTSVAEADVGKVSSGMAATFSVDAYPESTFRGTVREVRNAPQTVQSVVTYDAVIDVDNPALRLRPGMTAHVTFIYAERKNALKIPNATLRFRPSRELSGREKQRQDKDDADESEPSGADRRFVWALQKDSPQRIAVRVGLSDGTFIEILDGPLAEGDQVLVDAVEGQGNVKPASKSRTNVRLF
jgi:HlyD family secretion protein